MIRGDDGGCQLRRLDCERAQFVNSSQQFGIRGEGAAPFRPWASGGPVSAIEDCFPKISIECQKIRLRLQKSVATCIQI